MKNSCRLTLLTNSFRQLNQNQSVDSFVLLFEVHITFGFQSEVLPLFINVEKTKTTLFIKRKKSQHIKSELNQIWLNSDFNTIITCLLTKQHKHCIPSGLSKLLCL
jgi:hypothetical protein